MNEILEDTRDLARIWDLYGHLKLNLGQSQAELKDDKALEIENPRAINFYKKNGFVEFDKHIFKLGNDEQTDIMMKLQLKDK